MKRFLQLFFSTVFISATTYSQTILQESFDNTTFPPAGWYKAKISPTDFPTFGQWERVTDGTAPVVTPHSGAAMARFNSPNAGYGTISELGTPALNLTGGAMHRVRFRLYRMDAQSTNDQLEVFVNTQANITSGTKLSAILIARSKTPAETANGWYEYTCDVPASFNTASNYIIFRATGYSGNTIYIDDVLVETITCHKPITPTITNVATTSATLNWTAPATGTPSAYEWELRTTGSAGTGSTGLIASGSTTSTTLTASLSALTQGATYTVYVRSVCGTDKSTWTDPVLFTTTCNARNIPYTENFDAITTGIPNCSAVANVNGGNTWTSTNPLYGSYSGANAIFNLNGGTGITGPQDDWFFTAPLNLEAGKCYKLAFRLAANFSANHQNLRVRVGTAQSVASMASSDLISFTSYNNTSYQLVTANITVAQTGVYYFGFQNYSDVPFSNGYLVIDDINVTESIGVPLNITASPVQITTATISWSIPACGTPVSYDWELRTNGSAGSGTFGLISSGNTANLTTNLTGLTENTLYKFYVRSNNGSIRSEWTTACELRTTCVNKTLPYFENFDAVFSPTLPACYAVQDITPPYNPLNSWQTESYDRPYSGQNCLRIGTNNSTSNADNWLFTPPFEMISGKSYRLTFYYRNGLYSYQEKLEVKYGTAAMASAMIATPLFANTDIRNSIYKKAVVDFVPGQTGNYNIGFHYISTALQNFLFIDDIKVEETPACDVVQNIEAKNSTSTSAVINWQLPLAGNPDGFQWELRTDGVAGSGATGLVTSGTLPNGSATNTLTGLTANTSYNYYIRSICGAQNGEWVKLSFTSACNPVTLPYTEKFDGIPVKTLPACTAVEDTKDHYLWNVASTYSFSSPNSLTHQSESLSPLDDWFFTAPLNLEAGKNYRLSFYMRQQAGGSTDAIAIYIGNYAQSSTMTSPAIYTNNSITNTSFQLVNVDFTISVTGVYHLGIRSVPVAFYSRGTLIDDISVVENIPTAVRDIIQPETELLQNIYPNPVADNFMLRVNRKYDAGKVIVNIRDMQGRAVKTYELNLTGAENYMISADGLNSGMYLLETIHLRSGKKQTIGFRKK